MKYKTRKIIYDYIIYVICIFLNNIKNMSIEQTMKEVAQAEIVALRKEVERLSNELRKIKKVVFKTKISDPNFDKPLNQIEVNYEQVTTDVHGNS